MAMNTYTITSFGRGALAMLLAAALGVVACGCGVTEPDQARWQNVSAFSWPVQSGSYLKYRVEKRNSVTDSIETSVREIKPEISDELYENLQPMYLLHQRDNDRDRSIATSTLFLPLTDTLITERGAIPAKYALVAPLEVGRTWNCTYADAAETVPSWSATVVDRYSYRKVEGTVYKNVIEVEYRRLPPAEPAMWVQFYAEGIGPIQTIKYSASSPTPSEGQSPRAVEEQAVLIETSQRQN
jgi:hypothetical protein